MNKEKLKKLMNKEKKFGWTNFAKKYNLNYDVVKNWAYKFGIKSQIQPKYRNIKRGKFSRPDLSKEYKNIEPTKKFKQILIGSLLGDGCLSLGKANYYPYFGETHSNKQKSYLLWKMRYFKEFEPHLYKYKNAKQHSFKTKTHPYFTKLYNLFYPNGKKIINKKILNMLNPLGLAIWYMDDGQLSFVMKKLINGKYNYYRRVIFNTLGYSKDEHKIIKEILDKKFGFNITVYKRKINHPTKKIWCFYLKRKDTEKFIELIKPYIHKDLKYKIRCQKNIK